MHDAECDNSPDVNEPCPNQEMPGDNDHHDIVSFAQYGGTLEYVDAQSHVERHELCQPASQPKTIVLCSK